MPFLGTSPVPSTYISLNMLSSVLISNLRISYFDSEMGELISFDFLLSSNDYLTSFWLGAEKSLWFLRIIGANIDQYIKFIVLQ